MTEPETTGVVKYKVTMVSLVAGSGGSVQRHEAVDYVPQDLLDVYVADAKLRWQDVEVGSEPDSGPGGDGGATYYPAHLDHPMAGSTLPADESADEVAPPADETPEG